MANMTPTAQKKAATEFAKRWKDRGYEKGESQQFWTDLLEHVYGIDNAAEYVTFEEQVKIDKANGFIDVMIPSTHVMIEQKSIGKSLSAAIKQSDGSLLSPFQQAKRYSSELPYSQRPRFIVTCNFAEFYIYDMEKPNGEPEILFLKDLPKEYYRLNFLIQQGNEHYQKEMEVSVQAGNLVGKLYDLLRNQYQNPDTVESLKALNILCVRIVFCFYAEDSSIFIHDSFGDFLRLLPTQKLRNNIKELFQVLDTPTEQRDPYLEDDLVKFPYVNGGLFSEENIEIPMFTEEIKDVLVNEMSQFNWSDISPTIFGAIFESTLNPETRRSGGMHYTSIENIHKVIDPLFLDDLRAEFEKHKALKNVKERNRRLETFRQNLSTLVFFDPACGSGNFLTEIFLSLRRLENEALIVIQDGDATFFGMTPIYVSISQFYGIEINDFAVSVARSAMWIAEHKMMLETELITLQDLNFLPLKTYTNIVEGNSLCVDWETVVPKDKLSYIIGNPPFVGYSLQNKEQKEEILSIYIDEKGKPYKTAGKIDYVSGWYFKATRLMENTNIRTAFVSTNSITQGEQVAGVWKPLFERFGINIDFAHRTFRWGSEASSKANVHCVIVGFSMSKNKDKKQLFSDENFIYVDNINPYLIEAPNIFIDSRSKPICKVPIMSSGGKPVEGGNLIFTELEKEVFLEIEPKSKEYFRPFIGSDDYINNHFRWCLWLVDCSPKELRSMPHVCKRVEAVRKFRLKSVKENTRKYADYATRFMEIKQPSTDYILVPATSSENRRYIPIGYVDKNVIASNATSFVPNATLYHFGILTSNVHMAWMRAVCGRLEMRYRYSINIVYNNFPWCTPTAEQKTRIEQTAQAILDARALYPDCSLADLYDELTMPPELRKAHQMNDKAVMEAYGFWGKFNSESECVAALMQMYQKIVTEKEGK